MKKLFTLAAAVLASISLSWAAYDVPAEGTVDLTDESTAKVSSNGQFKVVSSGLYAYRPSSGYSYSGGNGLKTQSNAGGFVFYLSEATKVTPSIKHNESKNAHTVTINVYDLTEAEYKQFDDKKSETSGSKRTYSLDLSDNTTTNSFTISITAETKVFTETKELAVGYYAIVPVGERGNTYMSAIAFEPAAIIVDPVTEVTVSGEATASIGYPSEYTASTDVKADAYKWFVNDVEQEGATAKTFTLTPAASDTYSIVCKARNANNATDEWIASDAKVVKAYTLHGELIKATHTGKTTATVTGLVGGTADKSTQSDGKFGSNGHYFGITLASGSFQAGDTLNVNIGTVANQGTITLYQEKEGTNVLYNTEAIGVVGDNKFVLPAALDGKSTFYIVRPSDSNKWNAVVNFISVIRPMATISTAESLTAVSINDVVISDENLASLLSAKTLILEDSYIDAPVVKFTKHVVTTYEDDSQKEIDEVIEKTSTVASAGVWGASATIGENTYSVYTVKQLSYVVTYKDGEETLGTENVSQNGSPANYSQYQSKSLATFVAWYSDAALENAVTIGEAVITQDTTFYAKFENAYATSVNFEKIVMQNSKGYAIIPQLGTQHYASNITGSLDSLDNSKSDKLRNYAYLGLKVKQNGALLNFRLAAGKTVKIKFGDIKTANPHLSVNEGAYAEMTITDKVFSYTAEADALLSIKTVNGDAVVFQQIAIGEELAAPELFSITCATVDNGTFATPYKLGIPNENVVITATPADGYKTALVLVNETRLTLGEEISFDMPAENVTITGEFTVSGYPTALDNTDAANKAIKTIENGQIVIIKNGVRYNVLGAELR